MTDKSTEDAFAVGAIFIFEAIALPAGIIMWAWACWMTWGWFAPVVSAAMPILSFAQCVALSALLAPWRSHYLGDMPKKTMDERAMDAFGSLLRAACAPPLVVAIAWVIHLLVRVPAEVRP